MSFDQRSMRLFAGRWENAAAAVQNWEFQISSLEVFIVIGEVQVRLQQFSPPAIFDTVSSLEINQREISKLFNFSPSCAAVRHTHVLAGVMATSASVKMKPEDDSIKNVNFTKLLESSPRQPSIFLYVTHQHSARWKTFSPGWCGGKSFATKIHRHRRLLGEHFQLCVASVKKAKVKWWKIYFHFRSCFLSSSSALPWKLIHFHNAYTFTLLVAGLQHS